MALEHLLEVGEGIPAPEKVRRAANLQDVRAEHARSLADPEGFWGEQARRFRWSQPWTRVLDWRVPDHKWFLGAKCNITENALDRHADGPRRDHPAFVCIDEDGTERSITYRELRDLVSRLASGLRSLGVGVGDRVIIYMPLTLEGIASMLAVARLGAVHSVVYAGLGVGALRDRIEDAGAKVIIAGDVGVRRGKAVELQGIVDEALTGLDVPHVLRIGDDLGAGLRRQVLGDRIAGDDDQPLDRARFADRVEDVGDHRRRQLAAAGLVDAGGQPLLGRVEALDG